MTSLVLPPYGLGCWQFGSKGEEDYWGLTFTQSLANELVTEAIANGITFFDTAEDYAAGGSEIQLGEALKTLTEEQRSKAIVGSKILPNHCGDVRTYCEKTLERLGLTSIDLYMVHWPITTSGMAHFASAHTNASGGRDYSAVSDQVGAVPSTELAFRTLAELQNEGKIKHIAVSNFGVAQLKEALATGVKIASNELSYNLIFRAIEFDIIPFCKEQGIQVLAYSPLMQGILTGRWSSISDMPLYRTRTRHFDSKTNPKSRHGEGGHEELLLATLDKISKISESSGFSMVDLALAWPLHTEGVTCVIAGATKSSHVQASARAATLKVPEAVIKELTEATEELKQAMGKNADLWQGGTNGRVY